VLAFKTGCIYLPVLPIIDLDTEGQNIPALFSTVFGTNCYLDVLVMFGKVVYGDKEPKNKQENEIDDCVREIGGVGLLGQGNEYCYSQILLWYKEMMIPLIKKVECDPGK
jgi:hypothetical protein